MARKQVKRTAAPDEAVTDGRRIRAAQSRARIVKALLEFARDGVFEPGADAVAERAGVGRRTVFRLFKDMDSLYAEMHVAIHDKVKAVRDMPLDGAGWRECLDGVITRRLRLFDDILHVKMAADAHRTRSQLVDDRHAEIAATLRQMLAQVLPKSVKDDRELFEALDAGLSIEVWRRLRRDQGLSAKAAGRVVRRIVTSLLGR